MSSTMSTIYTKKAGIGEPCQLLLNLTDKVWRAG